MAFRSCSHIKSDGQKCNAPALRRQSLCYFHHRWQQRQQRRILLGGPVGTNNNTGIEMPTLESHEEIQIGLMEIIQAVLDDRINSKRAGQLLYALQIASANMRMKEKPGIASLRSVTEIKIEEAEAAQFSEPPIEPNFTIAQSENWSGAAESYADCERRNAYYSEVEGELFDRNHPHDRANYLEKMRQIEHSQSAEASRSQATTPAAGHQLSR